MSVDDSHDADLNRGAFHKRRIGWESELAYDAYNRVSKISEA
jgi:hypothetical protein